MSNSNFRDEQGLPVSTKRFREEQHKQSQRRGPYKTQRIMHEEALVTQAKQAKTNEAIIAQEVPAAPVDIYYVKKIDAHYKVLPLRMFKNTSETNDRFNIRVKNEQNLYLQDANILFQADNLGILTSETLHANATEYCIAFHMEVVDGLSRFCYETFDFPAGRSKILCNMCAHVLQCNKWMDSRAAMASIGIPMPEYDVFVAASHQEMQDMHAANALKAPQPAIEIDSYPPAGSVLSTQTSRSFPGSTVVQGSEESFEQLLKSMEADCCFDGL
jgi:hypothetical protein